LKSLRAPQACGSRYHLAMRGHEAHDSWAEGIELFNTGRFFDCHEVWEEVWKRSSGAEKLFYQGMIQAAVAILHAQRGNPRGARSTWGKARAKLEPLPAEHMGIALAELRAAVDAFINAANEGGSAPLPTILRR
jgi:predicted metal-dependent hydrolase